MKVYLVINLDELEAKEVIQAVFISKEEAIKYWECFRSDRFHYEVKEYEVIE